MSDLISRKETIRYLREHLPLGTFMHRGYTQADIACWDVCNMIADRVPSAEPEERTAKVIGKSVNRHYISDFDWIGKCENCGNEIQYSFDYCPYCGTKLDWSCEDENAG